MINEGDFGEKVREGEIPKEMLELVKEKREILLQTLADYDDELAMGLMEDENYQPPSKLTSLNRNHPIY